MATRKTPTRAPRKEARATMRRMALTKLTPHPKNPRVHPDPGTPGWKNLRRSLEHDYFDPLIWNKRNGMLVSGHLRYKVMADLGFTHADVIVVDYDEETHVARMIAANKNQGADDEDALTDLLAELGDMDIDLELTGLTAECISRILPDLGESVLGDQENDAGGHEELPEGGIMVQVGPYRFKAERDPFVIWVENVRQKVGFDEKAIVKEIRRRLKL